jgi:hypothetical protein
MDQHSFEKLDPDPHSPKKLDPDPIRIKSMRIRNTALGKYRVPVLLLHKT